MCVTGTQLVTIRRNNNKNIGFNDGRDCWPGFASEFRGTHFSDFGIFRLWIFMTFILDNLAAKFFMYLMLWYKNLATL